MRAIFACVFILLLAACDNGGQEGTEVSFTGSTMGTTFNVKVVDLPETISPENLKNEINAILKDVNDKMSLWVSDSELVKLNQNTSTDWISISEDLYKVTASSQGISEISGGVFDVTIEPLIKLWGFSTKNQNNTPPTPKEIQSALEATGYKKIELQKTPPAIRKTHQDLQVNLSAIAKGFGIDQLANHLEKIGLHDYMVEIGGDLRVKGRNAQRSPWRVAIETPDAQARTIHRIIQLDGVGMATSGDYRNFFEDGGKRYTHIIDPRNGMPVAHSLASVTVISENAMKADGLATALLALGEEKGPQLAEKEDIAAFFIIRTADGFAEQKSSAFAAFEKK